MGNAIKTLRMKRQMTQADLAYCLDVTDKAVSKWERGIGIPDISTIAKLSSILNTDIDNLLEGNIAYLEHSWNGVLILKEKFFLDNTFGKPSVYFPLCYFILCGIREEIKALVKFQVGNGSKWGLSIAYCDDVSEVEMGSTMVIWGTPFLFGINLTRYFQRAISKKNKNVIMTIPYNLSNERIKVSIDEKDCVQKVNKGGNGDDIVPIMFLDKAKAVESNLYAFLEKCLAAKNLYSQPFGQGMVYKDINNIEDSLDVANFISFYEKSSGKKVYRIEEVAWRRGLITKKEYQNL